MQKVILLHLLMMMNTLHHIGFTVCILLLKKFNVSGVLGPVLPYFSNMPKQWILNGKIFNRPRYNTGKILNWENTRTGNVLLKKSVFKTTCEFNPAFGSGGEDKDFFRRKILKVTHSFGCDDGIVFEYVPIHRQKLGYMIKRAFLRGKAAVINESFTKKEILKSSVAVYIYTISLPALLIIARHLFFIHVIKIFDHIGKIAYFLELKQFLKSTIYNSFIRN